MTNETKTPEINASELAKSVTPKYSKEELLSIFDDILFQGYYQEDVTLKDRLTISFRTRSAEDTAKISRIIDAEQYQLSSTYMEHRALLNLATSMVTFNGKDMQDKTLEDRFIFVKKLPAHLVALLSKALVEFDTKVETACKDGDENF